MPPAGTTRGSDMPTAGCRRRSSYIMATSQSVIVADDVVGTICTLESGRDITRELRHTVLGAKLDAGARPALPAWAGWALGCSVEVKYASFDSPLLHTPTPHPTVWVSVSCHRPARTWHHHMLPDLQLSASHTASSENSPFYIELLEWSMALARLGTLLG